MKVHINTNEFRKAFNFVKESTSARDVRPVLMDVKMVVEDDHVTLMANDGQIGVRSTIIGGVLVESTGETMIPTKVISKLLPNTDASEIAFETNSSDNQLHVKAGAFSSRLSVVGTDGFIETDNFNRSNYFEINAKQLVEALQRTGFSTDTQNAHFSLGGIHLETVDSQAFFVSTDGRRLSVYKRNIKEVGETNYKDVRIPVKTAKLISKVPFKDNDLAMVAFDENGITVKINNAVIFSNVIEGRFPKWQSIVSKSGSKRAQIPRNELKQVVAQTNLLTTEKNPGLWFNVGDNELTVSSRGAELGDAIAKTPIQYQGKECKFSIDGRFVLEYLNYIQSEQIIDISFENNDTPVRFTTDDDYMYVVMPLK